MYTFLILFFTLVFSGVAGYCLLWASKLGDDARQSILYLLESVDGTTPGDMLALKNTLDLDPDIHTTEYISPERVAVLLQEDGMLSADADSELVEELPAFLAVRLTEEIYNRDAVEAKLADLRQLPNIQGVYAQSGLLEQLQANLLHIGKYLGWIGLVVLLFASFLLANIIKLHLYSDRHEIKTMQLTGAAPSYIRRPYLRRNVGLAFWAGAAATVVLLLIHTSMPGLMVGGPEQLYWLGLLVGGLFLLGLLLSAWVTYHMVNRYIFADIASIF